MPTPSKFTCGAVESVSVKDYIYKDGKPYVNLIQTAVRGLEEKLRVELKAATSALFASQPCTSSSIRMNGVAVVTWTCRMNEWLPRGD